jgi:hypothetical protein
MGDGYDKVGKLDLMQNCIKRKEIEAPKENKIEGCSYNTIQST